MRALGCTLIAGHALIAACTLIADVDREKIPEPAPPPLPEFDAGHQPDAADAGSEPSAPEDAGADSGDASPEAPLDAATDAADAAG